MVNVWNEIDDVAMLEPTTPELGGGSPAAQYPTASSRLMLDLLRLSRSSNTEATSSSNVDALDSVIARPVLRSLLAALRLRDAATIQHVRRSAQFATGLARFIGWEGVSLRRLEVAALLHDIGKIGVPDHVLFKPGPLNPAEEELFALQHHVGIDVLQACRVHQEVLEIINQTTPNYDRGQHSSKELHLGARILAIADAYDSLSHKQVYRDAKSHSEILSILAGSAGTRFDGNLVGVMNRWIQAEGVPFSRELQESPTSSGAGFFQLAEEMQASSMCHIFSYLHTLESMYDGFYLVESDLKFRIWNSGMERLLGRPASKMLDQTWTSRQIEFASKQGRPLSETTFPLREVIKSGKAQTAHVQVRHADGRWINVELMSVPLFDHDGSLQGVAEIFRDLSQDRRRRAEDKNLRQQATRDALTGVFNRGELERTLESLLSEFNRDNSPEPMSLIFLDVDHFKSIKDTYLHLTGDQVLTGLAKLLQSETYSGEIIGRYGGEEFIVMCPATDLKQAIVKAERLRRATRDATLCSIQGLKITASFGVTEFEQGDTLDDVFRRADKALFTSKERGRDRTTALSKKEFLDGKSETLSIEQAPTNTFEGNFLACVTSDMIVLKLGSFVREQKARLMKTAPGHAVIRVGGTFLLPIWGSQERHQPVDLEIKFGPPPKDLQAPLRQVVVERTYFQIQIKPRGWPPNVATFQERARMTFRLLKSYFVAD
jgi:diguanylate cyclase (GGDEF)-like protein/PAS domain S-box-containing protein